MSENSSWKIIVCVLDRTGKLLIINYGKNNIVCTIYNVLKN
jgi:hypothetical protein